MVDPATDFFQLFHPLASRIKVLELDPFPSKAGPIYYARGNGVITRVQNRAVIATRFTPAQDAAVTVVNGYYPELTVLESGAFTFHTVWWSTLTALGYCAFLGNVWRASRRHIYFRPPYSYSRILSNWVDRPPYYLPDDLSTNVLYRLSDPVGDIWKLTVAEHPDNLPEHVEEAQAGLAHSKRLVERRYDRAERRATGNLRSQASFREADVEAVAQLVEMYKPAHDKRYLSR